MRKFLSMLSSLGFVFYAHTQQSNSLTTKDYEQAESLMGYNTQQFIDHGSVNPEWLPGDKFWYRTLVPNGSEFILVDPVKGTITAAFDQQKLATALSTATGRNYSSRMLPFQFLTYSPDGKSISFRIDKKQWKCDLQNYSCMADSSSQMNESGGEGNEGRRFRGRDRGNEVLSPDGTKTAFIKDYNLWVRDVKTKRETQLTTDGVKDFGYATDNAGWIHSDRPTLRWSPDSKKIATYKQDQRKVGDMYLASTNVGHPTLKSWKYPLPGDKEIPMISRCVITIDDAKIVMF